MLVDPLSLVETVCHLKKVFHRTRPHFHARLACVVALFHAMAGLSRQRVNGASAPVSGGTATGRWPDQSRRNHRCAAAAAPVEALGGFRAASAALAVRATTNCNLCRHAFVLGHIENDAILDADFASVARIEGAIS
jgi:hypothetical protein